MMNFAEIPHSFFLLKLPNGVPIKNLTAGYSEDPRSSLDSTTSATARETYGDFASAPLIKLEKRETPYEFSSDQAIPAPQRVAMQYQELGRTVGGLVVTNAMKKKSMEFHPGST